MHAPTNTMTPGSCNSTQSNVHPLRVKCVANAAQAIVVALRWLQGGHDPAPTAYNTPSLMLDGTFSALQQFLKDRSLRPA